MADLGPQMDGTFRAWMAKTQEAILEPDLPIIVRLQPRHAPAIKLPKSLTHNFALDPSACDQLHSVSVWRCPLRVELTHSCRMRFGLWGILNSNLTMSSPARACSRTHTTTCGTTTAGPASPGRVCHLVLIFI
jgi:hypothetical protein